MSYVYELLFIIDGNGEMTQRGSKRCQNKQNILQRITIAPTYECIHMMNIFYYKSHRQTNYFFLGKLRSKRMCRRVYIACRNSEKE